MVLNGTTTPTANDLPPQKQHKYSVVQDGENMYFIMPAYSGGGAVLPPELPAHSPYYNNERQKILLKTPYVDDQWASVVNKAATKVAASGFEVTSDIPLRRKRWQDVVNFAGAGMGLYGWTQFLMAGVRSFLLTGFHFIEIERVSNSRHAKAVAFHHLNPLHCRLTGYSSHPVAYLAKDGEKLLADYQVGIIADGIDPTGGKYGQVQSAAARAYHSIIFSAVMQLLNYEKVSGLAPTEIHFVQGVTPTTISDIIASSREDAIRKGVHLHMGAAIAGIMGDVPLNVITIPLKGLPENFDPESERLARDLVYANAIGMDPTDVNPALIGNRQLGAGMQSLVFDDKAKGQGLVTYIDQMVHFINWQVFDKETTFALADQDQRDELAEAKAKQERQKVRNDMIDRGIITPQEARNLAVDDGDLPPEFVQNDITAGGTVSEDEKVTGNSDDMDNDMGQDGESEITDEVAEKSAKMWREVWY